MSDFGRNEAYASDLGLKDDEGKAALDLVPWESVLSAAAVFDFGRKKYGAHNWHGLSKSRLFGAALRHLIAWWTGEDNDRETGLPHLSHATCCLLMLASSYGKDDRPSRNGYAVPGIPGPAGVTGETVASMMERDE